MEASSKFTSDLIKRRVEIVHVVSNIFLFISIATFLASALGLVNFKSRDLGIISQILSFILIFIFLFIRLYLLKRSFRISFFLISILPFSISIYFIINNGISVSIGQVFIFVTLLITGVVMGIRVLTAYSIVLSVLIVFTYHAHRVGIINYTPDTSASGFGVLLVTLMFIFSIRFFLKMGYGQIDHSYDQAYKYAQELEQLNKELEARVEERTAQLRENFEMQIDSMHKVAMVGRITSSLLHDFSSPLSAMEGAIRVYNKSHDADNKDKAIEIVKLSAEKLQNILLNSRGMLESTEVKVEFSPSTAINKIVSLYQFELNKEGIETEIQIDPDIKLFGIEVLFERIIMNIVTNSIDELKEYSGNSTPLIKISSYVENNNFCVEIEDNGRGIPMQLQNEIFEPFHSEKNRRSNLGFGLAFAKGTIEKHFGGEILLESDKGQGAKFILIFKEVITDE